MTSLGVKRAFSFDPRFVLSVETTTIRISRHDQLQLEIKLNYPPSSQRESRQVLDLWFYLPPASGIGSENYSSTDFYQDLRSYTRMTIPVISMESLLQNGEGSPLASLNIIDNLIGISGPSKNQQKRIRKETRLLSCIFHRILDRKRQEWITTPDKNELSTFIVQINQFMKTWREIKTKFLNYDLKNKTIRSLEYIDESISMHVLEYAKSILQHVESNAIEQKQQILQLIHNERTRADSMEASTATSTDGDYLIRQSNLKKYATSVLFLHPVNDRLSSWVRHLALSFAAGLAMSWAILAQFFIYFQLGIELEQSMSIPLFIAFSILAIFSYVLKDRIKSTSALYFSKRVSQWLYDRKHLYFMTDENTLMAEVSERMHFIHSEKAPKGIRKKWARMEKSRLSLMVGGEILCYHRTMKIHNRNAHASFSRFHGISDILRIHLRRWVRTFDDPFKKVQVLKKDEVVSKAISRQYIIEVIARMTNKNNDYTWGLARIRVNRSGIIDVENIPIEK